MDMPENLTDRGLTAETNLNVEESSSSNSVRASDKDVKFEKFSQKSAEIQGELNQTFIEKPPQKLSKTLYGIDWNEYFPLDLGGNFSVQASNFDKSMRFMSQFKGSPHDLDRGDPRKEIYYRNVGDFFDFHDGDKVIGVFVGNPIDWSTYYIRSIVVSSEYRGFGFYKKCLSHLIETLTERKIKRIEIEVVPNNHGHLHVLNKMGFQVNGSTNSERWGNVLKLTRFTDERYLKMFDTSFCFGQDAFELKSHS